jgi:hypothetical protein
MSLCWFRVFHNMPFVSHHFPGIAAWALPLLTSVCPFFVHMIEFCRKFSGTGTDLQNVVHRTLTPKPENRISLGDHSSCHSAVREAKKHYHQVNGCFYCSTECHTQ